MEKGLFLLATQLTGDTLAFAVQIRITYKSEPGKIFFLRKNVDVLSVFLQELSPEKGDLQIHYLRRIARTKQNLISQQKKVHFWLRFIPKLYYSKRVFIKQ